MTPAEIQALLSLIFIRFADDSYARPTLAWLQGAFWDSFQADRFDKVGSYSRKNDCDNWARAYAQHAQDCHAMSNGNADEALAVGEFFYTKTDGSGHAICMAVVDGFRLAFIEPQNGTELHLTPNEIASCSFARF